MKEVPGHNLAQQEQASLAQPKTEKIARTQIDAGYISFNEYNKIKDAFRNRGFDMSFDAIENLAKKLVRTREFEQLNHQLNIFDLEEVNQILDGGATLYGVSEIKRVLENKKITTNLQEIILFEKHIGVPGNYYGHYNVKSKSEIFSTAINFFGIEKIRKIVAEDCGLDKAVDVLNYIKNSKVAKLEQLLEKDEINVIIGIAKIFKYDMNMDGDRGIGDVLKVIEAGFTIEEIIKFPFLISPLVTKK